MLVSEQVPEGSRMFAISSLKTSFSVKKADLAAQYHVQKQDLTRCFFFPILHTIG
jgi:hypothetical protein